MKKLIRSAAVTLVIVTVAAIKCFPYIKSSVNKEDCTYASGSGEKTETYYRVREYKGKIGVFDDETNDLVKMIDVFVFTLPENDKRILFEGYSVERDMLNSVIEDYTG